MFTVLVKEKGIDLFITAQTVEYIGPFADSVHKGQRKVILCPPNGDDTVMYVGKENNSPEECIEVFVMNEKGSTVAKYIL